MRRTLRNEAEAVGVGRDRVLFMGRVEGAEPAVLDVEVPPESGTPQHRHPALTTLVVVDHGMVASFWALGRTAEFPPPGPPASHELRRVRAACGGHGSAFLGGLPA